MIVGNLLYKASSPDSIKSFKANIIFFFYTRCGVVFKVIKGARFEENNRTGEEEKGKAHIG